MTAIFLDIDGVLCTPLSSRLNQILRLPPVRQYFDPISLFWLRQLVRRTGAAVILSSSWRDCLLMMDDPLCRTMLQNLLTHLHQNGTPLADVTPMLPHEGKGAEIAAWLHCTPCSHYVILDDRDSFSARPEIAAHWVPIPQSGLRRRQAETALQLLTVPGSPYHESAPPVCPTESKKDA